MFDCLSDEFFINLRKLMNTYSVISSKNIGYSVYDIVNLNDVSNELSNLFILIQDYYNQGKNPYALKVSKGYYKECYYFNYYGDKYLIGKETVSNGDYIISNVDYNDGIILKAKCAFIDVVKLQKYYNKVKTLKK